MPKVRHEVRDPLYGFVEFDDLEKILIDSFPFQRLRSIHQLAMCYQVYPGACHKRFEHSLGVMEMLFTLLAERYELGSVMVTSNLAFSQWEQIFKDPMTTAAAIDRLVHHCTIVELNVPSYRMETAKKARQGQT